MLFYLILHCVIGLGYSSAQRYAEGDSCNLSHHGETGVCRHLADCEPAKEAFLNYGEASEPCGHTGDSDLICCDEIEPEWPSDPHEEENSGGTNVQVEESKPKTISEIKCEEYFLWKPSPVIYHTVLKKEICAPVFSIINGTKAKPLEFPHMAHLGFTGEGISEPKFGCGGTLISEIFVLTAAHCLSVGGLSPTHVRLGAGHPQSRRIYRVTQKIPHPKYEKKFKYHDIALLRLGEKVSFTDYRRPACLHSRDFLFSSAEVTGWGWVDRATMESSSELLKAELPIVPIEECKKTYNMKDKTLFKGLDGDTMVCAGGRGLGKDTCQGDSGGPLQVLPMTPPCLQNIVGVTSFGLYCGLNPGVYTKVAAYVPWIEEKVWPSSQVGVSLTAVRPQF